MHLISLVKTLLEAKVDKIVSMGKYVVYYTKCPNIIDFTDEFYNSCI